MEVECEGAAELYTQLAALAGGLGGVRHVELQLSVMRHEPWDWALVLREVSRPAGGCGQGAWGGSVGRAAGLAPTSLRTRDGEG